MKEASYLVVTKIASSSDVAQPYSGPSNEGQRLHDSLATSNDSVSGYRSQTKIREVPFLRREDSISWSHYTTETTGTIRGDKCSRKYSRERHESGWTEIILGLL